MAGKEKPGHRDSAGEHAGPFPHRRYRPLGRGFAGVGDLAPGIAGEAARFQSFLEGAK